MIGTRKSDDNTLTTESIYEFVMERTGSHAEAAKVLEIIVQAEEELEEEKELKELGD